jgi:23S rRNA pseudouridine1911/1915/1917 synthase
MSGRTDKVTVEQSRPGQRLDTYLRSVFQAVSRGAIQRLIEEGHIKVNGVVVKPTHSPRAGEEISVYWPEPRPAQAQPEDIPLNIIYEDDDLVVLNKAPGIVVHPAAGNEEHTLVNALLHHCRGKLSGIGGVSRPGIVHRLDKDTSGCLVVAKNDVSHTSLAAQFAGRSLEKIYLAILCGVISRPGGDIRAAIARHATHRKRMAVTEDLGRQAWTSYRLSTSWLPGCWRRHLR